MVTTSPNVRHGSIYISVLGVSVLVLVLGLSAVSVGRVQGRAAATASDFAEARLCARSGIELAMLAVANDPYWRTNLGNGEWFKDRRVGTGSFTLSVSDPTDGDVTVGENHPLVLTCTGAKGPARYILSMRMEVGPRPGSCLEASMCSGGGLSVSAAELESDQTIRSNTTVTASDGARVSAAVEACTDIVGATYTGTTTVTDRTSLLPDAATVLDWYTTKGTLIPYTKLRRSDRELVENGSFELDLSDWYAVGDCTLALNLLLAKDGLASLRVTGRDSSGDHAATDITPSAIVAGHTYSVSCAVYTTAGAAMRAALTVVTDAGSTTHYTAPVSVPAGTWTTLGGTLPPMPEGLGKVLQATLSIRSASATSDYSVDAVSVRDMTNGSAYMMDGVLLSPDVNPYGAPNSRGVYVVDCAGNDVIITDTRVAGTLVVLRPGSGSQLRGSVCLEPAESALPAFMTDGAMTVSLSATALSESALGVNFNPPGSPYPYLAGAGTFTNDTASDSYPSGISGLVYAEGALTIGGDTHIHGVVVGNDAIAVSGGELKLRYNSIYLNNPPPGFDAGTVEIKPVPGTWQRKSN